MICRVPVSLNSVSLARDFSGFRNLGRCEFDIQSTQILFEVLKRNTSTFPGGKMVETTTETYLDLLRARDGDDIFALGEKPRQCDLARRCVVFLAEFLEALHELHDIREVLWAKPIK